MKYIITLIALLSFLLPLTSCKQNPISKTNIGQNIEALYTAPNTYEDHRSQQQLFKTKDGKIAYTDHGTGPAIVLLHGVPTSSWMYRKMIPELQKNNRVITVDFLGFGSSDKPDDKTITDTTYSPIQNAARTQALLTHLEIDQYTLLMHDMGGLVAWEMMRNTPENITHAVVLNTIINKQGFNHPNINPDMMTRQLMNTYSNNLTSATLLEQTFNNMGLSGEHKLSETECFGYVEPIREGSDTALYKFFTSFNSTLFERLDDNKTALASFKGETLVIWGEKDDILTTKQIPILQKTLNIPDTNIHTYPENSHFLAEEIPEKITTHINQFTQSR